MWPQAFEGTEKEKSQAYHSVMHWLWKADSAKHLSKAEATVTLDWLLDDEQDGDGKPQLSEQARQESRLVLRQALQDQGQLTLL